MTVVDNAHLEVTRFLILVIANASRGSVLLSMLMSQIEMNKLGVFGVAEVLNVGGWSILRHSRDQPLESFLIPWEWYPGSRSQSRLAPLSSVRRNS
jgi:hypothetical protein